MNRLTDNKIVLVTRPTRLAELVVRFNTVSQAKFYVEHQGADFADYLREDPKDLSARCRRTQQLNLTPDGGTIVEMKLPINFVLRRKTSWSH